MKKVFVVGNGGREDSICWKLRQEGVSVFKSPTYTGVYGYNDLVVIGPEALIAEGLTDDLESKGIPVFGPSKLAGRLETSKVWAKQFMQRNDIPTSDFRVFARSDRDKLMNHLLHSLTEYPLVIKEDGLCGGKGVSVCDNSLDAEAALNSIFLVNKFNSISDKIIIEDFAKGVEVSCFVLSDGKDYKVLPYCQDYKRVGEGDTGPNTGGMGAICPTPRATVEIKERVKREIIEPTLEGMNSEGLPYKGVLYIGLMIDGENSTAPINVIEYNVRFGDPECQVLMMLMSGDLLPFLTATTNGTLGTLPDPAFYPPPQAAITVVMCSQGYPGTYEKNKEITGASLDSEIDREYDPQRPLIVSIPYNNKVFHAGTIWEGDRWMTNGGRVLNVTVRWGDIEGARKKVYQMAEKINWEGCYYRKDIGDD